MMKNPIVDLENGGVNLYTSLTYTRVNTVIGFPTLPEDSMVLLLFLTANTPIRIDLIAIFGTSCKQPPFVSDCNHF